jgi:hypothetical protein
MYSTTVTYRLEIARFDSRGIRHALSPTEVAREVSFDSAAPFVAGAETFRTVVQIDALRDHLRDVARAACRTWPDSRIEITLFERPGSAHDEPPPGLQASPAAPEQATRQTETYVACAE